LRSAAGTAGALQRAAIDRLDPALAQARTALQKACRSSGYGAITTINIQLVHDRYPVSAHPVFTPGNSANLLAGQCRADALRLARSAAGRWRRRIFRPALAQE
jgi:hypothetical protein